MDFASNWNRNALDVQLRYERDQYFDQPNESSNEASISATGRIDVDHASSLTLTASESALTEPRTDADVISSLLKPVTYNVVSTGISGFREFGRFRFDAQLTSGYYVFDDEPIVGGGIYPESSRDEDMISERMRLSYAIGPDFAAYVQVTPNQSLFLHKPFNGLQSYNSTGYEVLTGVNAELTHLITADAGVGFLQQDYQASSLAGVSGLAFNVNLHYYPTQLLTVTLGANHSIEVSGLPGTPASNVDSVNVNADYEVLRNFILSPNFNFTVDQYPGTTRVDDRYGAGLKATYLVNRLIGLSLSYNLIDQTSTGGFGGVNFNDNQVALSITLQR
jgi:hypothetical protein